MKHILALLEDMRDYVHAHFAFTRAFTLGAILMYLWYEDVMDSMVWVAIAFALCNSYSYERHAINGHAYMAITIAQGVVYWLLSFFVFSQQITSDNLAYGYMLFLILNLIFGLPVIALGVAVYFLNDPKRIKRAAEA